LSVSSGAGRYREVRPGTTYRGNPLSPVQIGESPFLAETKLPSTNAVFNIMMKPRVNIPEYPDL
jgi:hypothetical protein